MAGVQGWVVANDIGCGPASEAALLRAGQAGDRTALERLLAPHKGPLFALCYGILGDPDDAEDAAQETFLKVLRGLSRFRGEASFRTWLFRIAVNLCLNWKRDRRPSEPLDETRFLLSLAADSPETLALRQLQMREALSTLRPHQRAALLLKEREGWSIAEIGVALRWNKKRVENELYRARRALVDWQRSTDEGEEQ
jgi:RNA polymerase sigma-70 factor (ECF subfamily)